MIGETLSHFKILDKLGQGGMGVVYRGVDMDLDRPVAIKILPPEAQQDEDSVGRFLREAKTASKLQHPAITTIYEFGVKADMRYLVMEFIEGKTLREMLEKGPLGVRQAVEIAVQVADALTLAGEKGIIHRDIKSENIMVTNRGQVKVLDFGLAKMVEKSGGVGRDTFKTAVGLVMGTISYMSPEQALGAELDARTDIYSLGVVLFEAVTGKLPFIGSTPNIVLAKILNQPPPSPSDSSPDLPPAAERLILKCLEKNRDQRYQSAAQLLSDLKSVKQQLEGQRGLGATVVVQPGKEARAEPEATVEHLQELVPPGAAVRTEPVALPPVLPPRSGPVAAGSGAVTAAGAAAAVRLRPVLSDAQRAWRLRVAFLVRSVRRLFSLTTAAYALGCITLFSLPLFRPERVVRLPFVRLLHDAIDPVLRYLTGLVSFNFTYQNFNFLLVGIALLTYIIQQIVSGRLSALEGWIQEPLLARSAGRPVSGSGPVAAQPMVSSGAREASRMSLLREYAAAKRILGEAKREMAFLAVDVVGSTRMKVGEDKLVIEHAFSEYKKFVERIFREFHVYKMAWTPDGVMACFTTVDEAVGAGRKLLSELDWFNRDVHQLRSKFQVRSGVNFGEVMIPDAKPLEEISDHVIDVAGHLQKNSEVNSLWVSGEAYSRLVNRAGLIHLDTQVDNHEVYACQKNSS